MIRPAVLRHIDQHCVRRAVTAFRLRAADAVRLMDYVEHLERREREAMERRLANAELAAAVEALPVGPAPCLSCGIVGGHVASCDANDAAA